jgi:hypothetical protein
MVVGILNQIARKAATDRASGDQSEYKDWVEANHTTAFGQFCLGAERELQALFSLWPVHRADPFLRQALYRLRKLPGTSLSSSAFLFSMGLSDPDAALDRMAQELEGAATEDIGRLRAAVSKADPELSETDLQMLTWAASFLVARGSRWKAMKQLLLVMAACTKAVTGPDLRYWREAGKEDPPMPWSLIPDRIRLLIGTSDPDTDGDPGLLALRTAFCDFCLERLKSRIGPNEGQSGFAKDEMIEPREVWRYCYARAAQELKVNPKGKGHHTLFWSAGHDPDEHVKGVAKRAYEVLRRGPELEEGHSPRRPLFAAFWWLRRAQVLEITNNIDRQGAQRTRNKEVSRTGLDSEK